LLLLFFLVSLLGLFTSSLIFYSCFGICSPQNLVSR
jgi:hypothetical protein